MLFNYLFNPIRLGRSIGQKILSAQRLCLSAVVIGVLTFAASSAHAACVPDVPIGWHVPFKMSTHGKNHVVSYSEGNLYHWPNTTSLAVKSTEPPEQLFSDREYVWSNPVY